MTNKITRNGQFPKFTRGDLIPNHLVMQDDFGNTYIAVMLSPEYGGVVNVGVKAGYDLPDYECVAKLEDKYTQLDGESDIDTWIRVANALLAQFVNDPQRYMEEMIECFQNGIDEEQENLNKLKALKGWRSGK